jgi:hypothetical protein
MAVGGIAVLLSVWFWLAGRHTREPDRNAPPASPHLHAELLPKPAEETARPVSATSALKATTLFNPPEPSAGKKLDVHGSARMQAALEGVRLKGQAARVDAASFAPLRGAAEGEKLRFPQHD